MTFGRIGAMGGNLIFPLLLQTGCGATFFTLGGTLIGESAKTWSTIIKIK